jgi:putative tricarboxylic transport membrane protein
MKDRGEVCFNALIFLGSIYLFHASRSFPRFQTADMLGPAIWPQWLLAATIVLTGVLLIRNFIELLKSRTGVRASTEASQKPATLSLLLIMSLSLAYAVALEYLGFLLSIVFFQVILLYILRIRSAYTLIVFPLGLTATFYLIFVKLLSLPFPRGEGMFLYFSRLFY